MDKTLKKVDQILLDVDETLSRVHETTSLWRPNLDSIESTGKANANLMEDMPYWVTKHTKERRKERVDVEGSVHGVDDRRTQGLQDDTRRSKGSEDGTNETESVIQQQGESGNSLKKPSWLEAKRRMTGRRIRKEDMRTRMRKVRQGSMGRVGGMMEEGSANRVEKLLIKRKSTKSGRRIARQLSEIADGDIISGNYKGLGLWYNGKVTQVHPDGLVDLLYDDGDVETEVSMLNIRLRETKKSRKAVTEGTREGDTYGEDKEAMNEVKERLLQDPYLAGMGLLEGWSLRKLVLVPTEYYLKKQKRFKKADGEGQTEPWHAKRNRIQMDERFAPREKFGIKDLSVEIGLNLHKLKLCPLSRTITLSVCRPRCRRSGVWSVLRST